MVIWEAQQRFGNMWAEIAKLLPGRTHNSVKNRFNGMVRKFLRRANVGTVKTRLVPNSSNTSADEEPEEVQSPNRVLELFQPADLFQ